MKYGLLVILAFVVLGGLFGTLILRDPGYVLIAYDDRAWETSLWFAIVVVLAVVLLLRLLIGLTARVTGGIGGLSSWNQRRRQRSAQEKTAQGLLLWAEGDWQRSRRLLTESAGSVDAPLVNYLHAARAAGAQGDDSAVESLLEAAEESTPGSEFAVNLTAAELLCDAKRYRRALARLLELRSKATGHPRVLALMIDCYEQLGDWGALLEVLPDAKAASAISDERYERLLDVAWRQRLAQENSAEVWNALPKSLKVDASVVAGYTEHLVANDQAAQAEEILRSALKAQWHSELVRLYGVVDADHRAQLAQARKWLRRHDGDAMLFLTLGRLSLREEAWPEAREFFEKSLRIEPTADVYGELGRLCIALGEVERGSEYLLNSRRELPEVPLPGRPTQPTPADVAHS